MKRLCLLGFVIAALFCSGSANGQDLEALLSKFKAETDLTRKERLLNEILQHSEAGPQLLALAERTSDVDTKWLAIRGIGSAKYEKAAPFLVRCLNHEHHWVRANAARALGEIRYQSVIPPLILLLRREKDGGVIEQTSLALQWLQAKEAIPVLKRAASHPSSQTRCWVLQAIGKLGTESDLPFLARRLYDPDPMNGCDCAAQAIEMITGEDFGFPKRSGPMNPLPPVEAARKWWKKNQSKFKRTGSRRNRGKSALFGQNLGMTSALFFYRSRS